MRFLPLIALGAAVLIIAGLLALRPGGASAPELLPSLPGTAPGTTTPGARPAAPARAIDTLLSGMHMTFNDEFDSFRPYTDAKGNTTCNAGGTGVWQTVFYFCSRTIFSNYESEVYIDPSFISYLNAHAKAPTAAANPITDADGVLTITTMPSDAAILSSVGAWAKYTSGLITTQYSFSQTYGYFEMRAKLPAGQGVWPAFWLLPVDKSWPPEVDAMEAFGDASAKGEGGRTLIHYASHSTAAGESCGGWHDVGVDITKDFHTYGVDVEPAGITYYFDGEPYAACKANSGTNKPFYVLANVAVGSAASWPGAPGAHTAWPARMEIDYIRAYAKN